MPRELHPENLIPMNKRTKEAQRKIAKQGAEASNRVQKEKKLLSQIYGEILSDKLGIDGNGKTMKDLAREILTGSPLIYTPSVKVSLMKEIREATEGSKVQTTGSQTVTIANAEQVKKIISKLDV
jgi:hypothetical protein